VIEATMSHIGFCERLAIQFNAVVDTANRASICCYDPFHQDSSTMMEDDYFTGLGHCFVKVPCINDDILARIHCGTHGLPDYFENSKAGGTKLQLQFHCDKNEC